jgi:predicted protein tyrosine phosphatase
MAMNELRAQCAGSVTQVDDNVFIGGYLAAANPTLVKRKGFTHILKLFKDDDSYPGGKHEHPGVVYMVVDADDTENYPLENDFCKCLEFVQEAVRKKGKILVHCHMGVSRSATIVLLHLMVNCGHTLDHSIGFLREKRPVVRPNPRFWAKLVNADERIRRFRDEGLAPAKPNLG